MLLLRRESSWPSATCTCPTRRTGNGSRTYRPASPGDWLLVVGDVAEKVADIEWALRTLSHRFGTVVWVPGNHDLWSHPSDPVQLRGEERYQHLVARCRELGVITPEDPYPVWPGAGGPAVIVPLFLLYDYTFRPDGASTKAEGLALAYQSGRGGHGRADAAPRSVPEPGGVVPGADRRDHARGWRPWIPGCRPSWSTTFPLTREPTRILRYPAFAQWCGTEQTADWHLRYRALAVVYGHLHIPRTTWQDGVRFEEVSLGYPQEQEKYPNRPRKLTQILPSEHASTVATDLV